MSSWVKEEVEPIYESVPVPRSPVNLFSSLVGSQETVSPDPNIYEVPPGAILNLTELPEDSPKNITPPNGFQDDRCERSNSFNELSPKLEDLYSRVIKPKKQMEVAKEITVVDQEDIYCHIEQIADNESSLTEPEDYASASESELDTTCPDLDKKENESLNKNIGAQIMERYEADKKKLVTSLDLPEVTILDVEESYEDIEKERRRIIHNQVVKKKRINSWIKENGMTSDLDQENMEQDEGGVLIEEVLSDDEDTQAFELYEQESAVEHHEISSENEGEIVYDSILQNKEKTKNYWEKLMLATKMAANSMKKAGLEESAGKMESVVEREIRLQREREEAVALERQNALKLAKYAEDGLHSIPTTDEGNYSECSEEKDQSLDSSGEQESRLTNYDRTASFESMSSGHSSGCEAVIKRKANRTTEEPRIEHSKVLKESPIEKDIRLTKEREEEFKPKPKILVLTNQKSDVKQNTEEIRRLSDNRWMSSKLDKKNSFVSNKICKDEIKAELETISLKKCVSMSSLPLVTPHSSNETNSKTGTANRKYRQTTRQSPNGETASKLFTPSKIPRGLMKRFIESHGRLPASFLVSPPPVISAPIQRKPTVQKEIHTPSPPVVKAQETSTPYKRPGYRSAEDKIQMELKEMKRREAELKQERARLLGRSQPNLQNIGLHDDIGSDDESCSLPQMGKLRSALSNPNLTNERMVIIPKRCNELIDAWESMIQKKSED